MVQRIAFHYVPGNSLLHRWDARCKFIGLLMITATLIRIRIEWLLFDLALFLVLLILSRLPFKSFFRNLLGWGLLLSVLFLFQALFTPGTRFTHFPWIPISREVSLALRFFSLILDQADEVRLAHKARLGDHQRNPVRKAKFLALPILRRSLCRAEDVTLALVARGYRDDIPLRLPPLPLIQILPVLCLLILFIIMR
jgi:energy-coupling factor transporter transmembrane protein EcfT